MSTISSSAAIPDFSNSFLNPAEPEIRSTGSKNLGVDDFLKLITVQLSNQDPLKPMEDTQFISQMASFTSLEQMQALSKSVRQSSAQDYLGKMVTVIEEEVPVSGLVSKVTYDGSSTLLTIGDREYDTAKVRSVSNAPAAATAPTTSTTTTTPASNSSSNSSAN